MIGYFFGKSVDIQRALFLVGLLGLMIFCSRLDVASAHTDGKLIVASEPAGPYKVSIWTWPTPPEPGEFHVSIAVTWAEDAAPVLDADVNVALHSMSEDVNLSAPATTENSENKFLYEVIMEVPESGEYEVEVSIVGSDGSTGEIGFEIEAVANSSFNPFILVLILLLAAVIIFWLFRKRRGSPQ